MGKKKASRAGGLKNVSLFFADGLDRAFVNADATVSAKVRVDNVDRIAFTDGFYWAYISATAATGAFVGDFVWHKSLLGLVG